MTPFEYSNIKMNLCFREFPGSTAITFTTWMVYALPSALVTIFAAWIFLTYYFINDQ